MIARDAYTGREMGWLTFMLFLIAVVAMENSMIYVFFMFLALFLAIFSVCRKSSGLRGACVRAAGITLLGLIVLGMFLPCCSHQTHENARRISCASNLKQIGLALKQYAMDNKDYFPSEDGAKGLERLVKGDYLSDVKCYICPSMTDHPAKTGETLITSYEYRGGLKEGTGYGEQAIAWDKPENHKNFVNVLFVDGHVQGMTRQAFDEMWKREAKK